MPRIFKFSKFALKLFVPGADKLQNLKLFIYTDNYDLAAEISEEIKVEGNIVSVVVQNYAVCNLNDGIINYIVKGDIEGGEYIFQRQSNYYLKSPSDYATCDIIDITKKFIDEGEGIMNLEASDFGVDGFGSVKIDATEYGEDKYEEGIQAQKELLEPITITSNGTYTREAGYNEVVVDVPQEGGGSVDTEEIEKINQTIDALDERLTHIDLIQYYEAIDGVKLRSDSVHKIADNFYTTDYYITGVTIDGVADNEVHIIWRQKSEYPNPLLPAYPFTAWKICGICPPKHGSTHSEDYMYVVSWFHASNISEDVEPEIKKIPLTNITE